MQKFLLTSLFCLVILVVVVTINKSIVLRLDEVCLGEFAHSATIQVLDRGIASPWMIVKYDDALFNNLRNGSTPDELDQIKTTLVPAKFLDVLSIGDEIYLKQRGDMKYIYFAQKNGFIYIWKIDI